MWAVVSLCIVVYAALTSAYHIELVPVAKETFYKDGAKHESVRYRVIPAAGRKPYYLNGGKTYQLGHPSENKHVYLRNNYNYNKDIGSDYRLQHSILNQINNKQRNEYYLPHGNQAHEEYLEHVRKYKLENTRIPNQRHIQRFMPQLKSSYQNIGNRLTFKRRKGKCLTCGFKNMNSQSRFTSNIDAASGASEYEAYAAQLKTEGKTPSQLGQEKTYEAANGVHPGKSEYINSISKHNAQEGTNTRTMSRITHVAPGSGTIVEGNTLPQSGQNIIYQAGNRPGLHRTKQISSIQHKIARMQSQQTKTKLVKISKISKIIPNSGTDRNILLSDDVTLGPGEESSWHVIQSLRNPDSYLDSISAKYEDNVPKLRTQEDASYSVTFGPKLDSFQEQTEATTSPNEYVDWSTQSSYDGQAEVSNVSHNSDSVNEKTHILPEPDIIPIAVPSDLIREGVPVDNQFDPNKDVYGPDPNLVYATDNSAESETNQEILLNRSVPEKKVPEIKLPSVPQVDHYEPDSIPSVSKENYALLNQGQITNQNIQVENASELNHSLNHADSSPFDNNNYNYNPGSHLDSDVTNDNNVGSVKNQNSPDINVPIQKLPQINIKSHAYSAPINDDYNNPDPYLISEAYKNVVNTESKIPHNEVKTVPVNDYPKPEPYWDSGANSANTADDNLILKGQPVHEPNVASSKIQGSKVPQNEVEAAPINDYYQPYWNPEENNPIAANAQSVYEPNVSDETYGLKVPQNEVQAAPINDYYQQFWNSEETNLNAANAQTVHEQNVASHETQGLRVPQNKVNTAPVNDYYEPYWDSEETNPNVANAQPVHEPNVLLDEARGSKVPQNEVEAAPNAAHAQSVHESDETYGLKVPQKEVEAPTNNDYYQPYWNSEETNLNAANAQTVHEQNVVSHKTQELRLPQNKVKTAPINEYYKPYWDSEETNPNAANAQTVYEPNVASHETQGLRVPQNKVETAPINDYYEPYWDSEEVYPNAANAQPVQPIVLPDETWGSKVPQNEVETAPNNDYYEPYWDSEETNPNAENAQTVQEPNVASHETQEFRVPQNKVKTAPVNDYYVPYWDSEETNLNAANAQTILEIKVASHETQGLRVPQNTVETAPVNDYYEPYWDSEETNPNAANAQTVHEPNVASHETQKLKKSGNDIETVSSNGNYEPHWDSGAHVPNAANAQRVYEPNVASNEIQGFKKPQNDFDTIPSSDYYKPHWDFGANDPNAVNAQPYHEPVVSDEAKELKNPQNKFGLAPINSSYEPNWDSEDTNRNAANARPMYEPNVLPDESQKLEVPNNKVKTAPNNDYYEPYWDSEETNTKAINTQPVDELKVANNDIQGFKKPQNDIETVPSNDYYEPHWDSGANDPNAANIQPVYEPNVLPDKNQELKVPQNEVEAVPNNDYEPYWDSEEINPKAITAQPVYEPNVISDETQGSEVSQHEVETVPNDDYYSQPVPHWDSGANNPNAANAQPVHEPNVISDETQELEVPQNEVETVPNDDYYSQPVPHWDSGGNNLNAANAQTVHEPNVISDETQELEKPQNKVDTVPNDYYYSQTLPHWEYGANNPNAANAQPVHEPNVISDETQGLEVPQNEIETVPYDDYYSQSMPHWDYRANNPNAANAQPVHEPNVISDETQELQVPQNEVDTVPNDGSYSQSMQHWDSGANNPNAANAQPVYEPYVISDETQGLEVPKNEVETVPNDDYYSQTVPQWDSGANDPNTANNNVVFLNKQPIYAPNFISDETQGSEVPQNEVETVPNDDFYYQPMLHWDSGANNPNAASAQPVHEPNVVSDESQGLIIPQNEVKSVPIDDYYSQLVPQWDSGVNDPHAANAQSFHEPNVVSDESQGSKVPQNEVDTAPVDEDFDKPELYWNSGENDPKAINAQSIHERNVVSDKTQASEVPQNEIELEPSYYYPQPAPNWVSGASYSNAANDNVLFLNLQPDHEPNVASDEIPGPKLHQNGFDTTSVAENYNEPEPFWNSGEKDLKAENAQSVHEPNVISHETQRSELPQIDDETEPNYYNPQPAPNWVSGVSDSNEGNDNIALLNVQPDHEPNVVSDETQASEVPQNEFETALINDNYPEPEPYWDSGANNPNVANYDSLLLDGQSIHEPNGAVDVQPESQNQVKAKPQVFETPDQYSQFIYHDSMTTPNIINENSDETQNSHVQNSLNSEVSLDKSQLFESRKSNSGSSSLNASHLKSIQSAQTLRDIIGYHNVILFKPTQGVVNEKKTNIPNNFPIDAVKILSRNGIYGRNLKTKNKSKQIQHNNYFQNYIFNFNERRSENTMTSLLEKYLMIVASLNKSHAPADVTNEITFKIINYLNKKDLSNCGSDKKVSDDIDDIVARVLSKHMPNQVTRRSSKKKPRWSHKKVYFV